MNTHRNNLFTEVNSFIHNKKQSIYRSKQLYSQFIYKENAGRQHIREMSAYGNRLAGQWLEHAQIY